MGFDTIILAVIAAVLFLRLWSVFGRRNGTDDQQPNPFAIPAPGAEEASDTDKPGQMRLPFKLAGAPPDSLAGALERIKALDPAFDEKEFLQKVRASFAIIVEDFAKGDLSRSRALLGPQVLPHFENAIAARQKAGQSMEGRILRIKDAETAAAHVEGTRADITVRFISEQENILRDSGGRIIGGGEGKVEEITDLWIFTRDLQIPGTNWILGETRS